MALFRSGAKFVAACVRGDKETVLEYLRADRAKWRDATDDNGKPALIGALFADQPDIALTLLAHGADPNVTDKNGANPLFEAAARKYPAVVRSLLTNGADPDWRNKDYCTAAHWAAYHGDVESLKALAQAQADFDIQRTDDGFTALMHAVCKNHFLSVEFLLEKGVRTDLPSMEGKTALDFAKEKQFTHLVKIIEAHEARKAPRTEQWSLLSHDMMLHVREVPELSRKLTSVFNFTLRDCRQSSVNTRDNSAVHLPPEGFDRLEPEVLKRACEEYVKLGGDIDIPQQPDKPAPAKNSIVL